jgi:hypothetical protein
MSGAANVAEREAGRTQLKCRPWAAAELRNVHNIGFPRLRERHLRSQRNQEIDRTFVRNPMNHQAEPFLKKLLKRELLRRQAGGSRRCHRNVVEIVTHPLRSPLDSIQRKSAGECHDVSHSNRLESDSPRSPGSSPWRRPRHPLNSATRPNRRHLERRPSGLNSTADRPAVSSAGTTAAPISMCESGAVTDGRFRRIVPRARVSGRCGHGKRTRQSRTGTRAPRQKRRAGNRR